MDPPLGGRRGARRRKAGVGLGQRTARRTSSSSATGLPTPTASRGPRPSSLYTAKPHGAGADRVAAVTDPRPRGRTMRIRPDSLVTLTTDKQKKDWLDLVGPAVVQVHGPRRLLRARHADLQPDPASPVTGDHLMLVVGLQRRRRMLDREELLGHRLGRPGFGRIAYAANMLEPRDFVGIRGTNPDPWAKRRQRTGALVQGGNGGGEQQLRAVRPASAARSSTGTGRTQPLQMQWNRVGPIESRRPLAAAARRRGRCPGSRSEHVQPQLRADLPVLGEPAAPRVLRPGIRLVVRRRGLSGSSANAIGIPGFIQSDRGAPGDFEVVAIDPRRGRRALDQAQQRAVDAAPRQWYRQESFGPGSGSPGPRWCRAGSA